MVVAHSDNGVEFGGVATQNVQTVPDSVANYIVG
jgi:hypothetical protein